MLTAITSIHNLHTRHLSWILRLKNAHAYTLFLSHSETLIFIYIRFEFEQIEKKLKLKQRISHHHRFSRRHHHRHHLFNLMIIMRLKNSDSLTNKTPHEKRICHKFKLWVLFARRIKLMKRVNRSEWTCHDLCIESHRWSIIPKLSYQNWCNRTVLVQIFNSIHGYHIFWPKIGTVVQIRIKISVFFVFICDLFDALFNTNVQFT